MIENIFIFLLSLISIIFRIYDMLSKRVYTIIHRIDFVSDRLLLYIVDVQSRVLAVWHMAIVNNVNSPRRCIVDNQFVSHRVQSRRRCDIG